MTKLSTRKSEIEQLERFEIEIFDGQGVAADLDMQGMPAYKNVKMAAGSMTVISYKNRFSQSYPGYTCDVLLNDGSVAHGNTKLKTVRDE